MLLYSSIEAVGHKAAEPEWAAITPRFEGCVLVNRARSWTPLRLALGASILQLLTACTPPLSIIAGVKSGPTVSDLVDHVACEIATEYDYHTQGKSPVANISDQQWADQSQLWQNLVTDNFVASIDFTLMVTHTDGFNPSLSYLTPLMGAGNPITPIVFSGSKATSTTFNRTLAIGLQLDGTQDRNVEQDYVIDIRSLVDGHHKAETAMRPIVLPGEAPDPTDYRRYPYCAPKSPSSTTTGPNEPRFSGIGSPLQGNVALQETIDDGLIALSRSSHYNIYGSSGPVRLLDVKPVTPAPPSIGGERVAALIAGGGAAPSSGSSTGASKTSFGSKVDFYITEGINGGPTISLLQWKIGGGSSSTAGSQLLNFTRMTQDSFTLTFGATCKAPPESDSGIKAMATVPPPSKDKSGQPLPSVITVTGSSIVSTPPLQQAGFTFTATLPALSLNPQVVSPPPVGTPSTTPIDKITMTSDGREAAVGTIQWSGYTLPGGAFSLRGVVTSALTGAAIGQIWMSGPDKSLSLRPGTNPISIDHFPTNIIHALNDDYSTATYWDSIAPCDTTTAAQKQSILNDLVNTNQLQTLLRHP